MALAVFSEVKASRGQTGNGKEQAEAEAKRRTRMDALRSPWGMFAASCLKDTSMTSTWNSTAAEYTEQDTCLIAGQEGETDVKLFKDSTYNNTHADQQKEMKRHH